MKETEFYEKMILKYAVDDETVEARSCASAARKGRVWKRAAAIAAATAAVLIGTVMLIPSARAEVMQWFSGTRPEEYLMEKPEERAPVNALDVLIVPPAPIASKEPAETVAPKESETIAVVSAAPEDIGESRAPESPDADTITPAVEEPVGTDMPEATPEERSEEARPVGSVTNNRILQVCDEEIWQKIAADFSMELGETICDGHNLYLSITMHGLTALPEIERYTGGNATQYRIGENDLAEYFEGGEVPEEYKNGLISLYEPLSGCFFLRLDDGTEMGFGPQYTIDFPEDHPFRRFFRKSLLTDDDRAEIGRTEIEWLQGRELRGVVRKYGIDEYGDWFYRNGNFRDLVEVDNVLDYLLSAADEDGILTGTVRYVVGSDVSGKYEVKLEAELGTACFDLKAYRNIERHSTEISDETVTWGSETVVIGKVGVDYGKNLDSHRDDRISLYKQQVSMDGVTMTAETENAEISALGIRNICICINVPDSWTQADREALAESLTFTVLLNGERGNWVISPYGCELEDDGTVRFTCHELVEVPYDKLESIQTITFVPVIRSNKVLEMIVEENGRHRSIGTLEPEYGETAWSPLGVSGWNDIADTTEYPQYAITLYVQ